MGDEYEINKFAHNLKILEKLMGEEKFKAYLEKQRIKAWLADISDVCNKHQLFLEPDCRSCDSGCYFLPEKLYDTDKILYEFMEGYRSGEYIDRRFLDADGNIDYTR
jgi:hypothetical protein